MNTIKRLLLPWFAILLFAIQASAANIYPYIGPTGQSLYGRVETSPGTFIALALTEETGGGKGRYVIDSGDLQDAGLADAGTYVMTIHTGATPSTTAEDAIVGSYELNWDGGGESTPTHVAQVNNTKIAAKRVIPLSNRVDGTTVATRPIRMRTHEKLTWWLDPSPIVGDAWVDDVTAATTSDTSKVTVAGGLNREMICVTIDTANAVVGQSYTTTGIAWFGEQQLPYKATIEILGD